jgi:alkanesulfonate monooxygenase SsuD/methylene tetrahydromethanopterin reductase-like flavin-dependent oxidoreductase (luciferase family)
VVDGRPVASLRFARKVPVFYSAFGPKALAMAGERADGVILFACADHLDALQQKIAAVHEAARAAGRDPNDVEIWAISYVAVRPTREAAIKDIKAFLVVNGLALRTPEAMALVPDSLKPAIRELQSRYDPTEHVVPGGPNIALMEELGLTEFLAGFETVIGTADQVAAAMRAMEAMGVSTFIAALPSNSDPLAAIRGLAEARDRM